MRSFEKSTGSVLFIDSDTITINNIRKELSNLKVKVYYARNSEQAFDKLENKEIDLIVSDLKFKNEDGMKLLIHLRIRYPKIPRMICCMKSSEPIAIKCVTTGLVKKYIIKPWYYGNLEEFISVFFETKNRMQHQKLLDEVGKIKELPSLPDIYKQLMDAITNEASYTKLAEIVARDVSIATRTLKLANSAHYGFEPTSSLSRAVMILGANNLRDLVLTFSVTDQMNWTEFQKSHLQAISIHSLVVNYYLEEFYHLRYGNPLPQEYHSVGITHDIGKIIQMQYYPKEYKRIIDYMKEHPKVEYHTAENELKLKGCSHSELGAYFLESWGLPETNINIAMLHHDFAGISGEDRRVLDVLEFLDYFSNFLYKSIGDKFWSLNELDKPNVFKSKDLMRLGDRMLEDMKQTFNF